MPGMKMPRLWRRPLATERTMETQTRIAQASRGILNPKRGCEAPCIKGYLGAAFQKAVFVGGLIP